MNSLGKFSLPILKLLYQFAYGFGCENSHQQCQCFLDLYEILRTNIPPYIQPYININDDHGILFDAYKHHINHSSAIIYSNLLERFRKYNIISIRNSIGSIDHLLINMLYKEYWFNHTFKGFYNNSEYIMFNPLLDNKLKLFHHEGVVPTNVFYDTEELNIGASKIFNTIQ